MPTLAPSRRRARPPLRGGPPPVDTTWRGCWEPPADEPVDVWAERVLILPRAVSARPGPLDLSITPYLREILQAMADPEVSEVSMKTASQIGKTLACISVIFRYADQDPWPCLHVMPREEDAQSINVDRYQPVIRASPLLARHLSEAAHDATRDTIRMNGAVISFVGANSPAALASKAICILILDECDKYPSFAGREADPIALARERTKTFHFSKILKTSTPTTEFGYIHREYLAGDQRRYHVPCPHCGVYQPLLMTQHKWPAEQTHGDDVAEAHSAWYECLHCHQRILDGHKLTMLRKGVWCPAAQTVRADGTLEGPAPSRRHLSYHLPAWYSSWLSWSDVAAEFLRSRASPAQMMNFRNSWEAEIWEEKVEEIRGSNLRARRQEYIMGTVPPEAHVLTGGIDVQVDHLWYVLRGWGAYGESWLVRCGQLRGWEELHRVLFQSRYMRIGGRSCDWVPLQLVFIDAGFRTDEVYGFCRATGCQAVRGASSPRSIFSLTKHQHADGSFSPLVLLDTAAYKVKQHRLMRVRDGDPGAWHLPADTPEEYFEQMVAEQRVRLTDKKTGRTSLVWKIMRQGAPNHIFDCENYALAAADYLDVEHRYGAPTMTGVSPPGPPLEAAEGPQTDAPQAGPQPQSILQPKKRPFIVRKGMKSRFFGG